MDRKPRISIVLPTYNGSRYLSQSIESCIAQSFVDWELIVVDDCSRDSTPAIISDYAARDARIRCVRNRTNLRLPASLNVGFGLATGGLFTWTSDDNMYRPTALEQMRRRLDEDPRIDLVYSGYTNIDGEGREVSRVVARPIEQLASINVVNACFLYRRRVHEVLGGYDPSAELVEDYDFWLRASTIGRMSPIDEDLYLYRLHAASLTSQRALEIVRAYRVALGRHLPRMQWVPRRERSRLLYELACTAEWSQGEADARRLFLAALRADPLGVARRSWKRSIGLVLGRRFRGGLAPRPPPWVRLPRDSSCQLQAG